MRITYLHIKNFKSIKEVTLDDIDNALILVGKNNSGKSVILDAVRAISGEYIIKPENFHEASGNIIMDVKLQLFEGDLTYLHSKGLVSNYKHFDRWYKDFCEKLPSFKNGILEFQFVYRRDGQSIYKDGIKKNNPYIKLVMPRIYYVNHSRNNLNIQEDINMLYGDNPKDILESNNCIFDKTRVCNQCFNCIGYINKKTPEKLSILETARLIQYKLYNNNLNTLSQKLNENFKKNGGHSQEIKYEIKLNDIDGFLSLDTVVTNPLTEKSENINKLGEGLKSIYMMSLLETYVEINNVSPYIIVIEEPEIYLHPELQKVAAKILYKLSKKNQVMFSTHAPVMIFNFSSKQIRQVVVDEDYSTVINPKTNIDVILNDLGYTANDLMNVSFVFIVEGKQDKSRLPLLLKKYYSEIVNENGEISRVAIIATNSCTNIKTYANLKYINSLYLKDSFLMIRDSDGKDKQYLKKQLCGYYSDRAGQDTNLPRVTAKNVLILKYYSFENYFLDPKIMAKIGVVKSEEEFFEILFEKYKEYLYKLSSTRKMLDKLNIKIETIDDLKENLENIRIYVRGHNLFDIFYGRYKGKKESDILMKYIATAPKECFEDILQAVDNFVYFAGKKN